MKLAAIEERFVSYLETSWALADINPFLRTYIRLVLLFKDEIPEGELFALQERQRQLRGEAFKAQAIDELRKSSRSKLDRDVSNNSATRQVMLNRLIFCASLDSAENDFFYLTEPIFEFVRKMEVPPHQLSQVLESEFIGLKIES